MSETHWYIKNCRLFERLSREQILRLERCSRLRTFPKQTSVYLPTDPADGALLLTQGRVKLSHLTEKGKEAILAYIEPGELFGELALIGDTTREESAVTLLPSTIIFIPADELERMMAQSADLALGVSKLFGLRRRRIERRLKLLLFRSNRHRLVHLLLELTEQYGKKCPEGIVIGIKLSHQDLANIIGSTRETVTTLLGTLQSEGTLQISRQCIVIRNPQILSEEIHAPVRLPSADGPHIEMSPKRISPALSLKPD
ncbi:MAG: Crp/Fnr family transcriptional regulator [Planctomycetota bacterium]|nr:Crp/Fnr family transcriptional regulator [Planctomycetota bacterium]MDA1212345.1 Crp/Fnr family transcriptional regulator [Planctomycetota bacterium]